MAAQRLRLTAAALEALEGWTARADGRCFLWVHYQDPHGPYAPQGDRRRRFLEAERDAPEIAAALRAKLLAFREKMTRGPTGIRQKLTPADREKLRALGYVADP